VPAAGAVLPHSRQRVREPRRTQWRLQAPIVCALAALLTAPLPARSADADQPAAASATAPADVTIATDRPAVTESSVVVPQGGLQLESGFLTTDTGDHHLLDFPEADLRYGLLEKTELRLSLPDYYHNLAAPSSGASGFGDTTVGLKQQLGPVYGFDLSLIPSLSLPTGAQPVSSHGYDPALQLPWSRSLSASWTVAGQLAAYWPTVAGRHRAIDEATLLFDRQLTASCDAFIEYAADVAQRGGTSQLLHVGAAYRLTAHHQLDVHAAAGLSQAAPRSFIGVGYSYLFLR